MIVLFEILSATRLNKYHFILLVGVRKLCAWGLKYIFRLFGGRSIYLLFHS